MSSAGDDACAAFARREWPRLVGMLSLYVGDAAVAEELAQEALARAVRNWRRVDGMAAPGAWIHRVAINLANSHYQRRRAERTAMTRLAGLREEGSAADLASTAAVRSEVARLPKRQRTALVLRYYSDLPVDEVAELMSCAPGTVKALTSQAIATLRTRGHLAEVAKGDLDG